MVLEGHLDRAGLNRDEARQTAGMRQSLAEERHKVQESAELGRSQSVEPRSTPYQPKKFSRKSQLVIVLDEEGFC